MCVKKNYLCKYFFMRQETVLRIEAKGLSEQKQRSESELKTAIKLLRIRKSKRYGESVVCRGNKCKKSGETV